MEPTNKAIDKDVITKAIGHIRYSFTGKISKNQVIEEIEKLFSTEDRHWIDGHDWDKFIKFYDETKEEAETKCTDIAKRLFPEFFEL